MAVFRQSGASLIGALRGQFVMYLTPWFPPKAVVVTSVFDCPATTREFGEAAANEQTTLRGQVPQPKESSWQVAVQFAVVLGAPMITFAI
jgi:hypothetical protein